MSSVGSGHSSRRCNLDPSLPDGTHSGIAILSTLTSVTPLCVCVCTCLNECVCVCVHVYVNVTLKSLSSHASLSKAQAIWCPLSESFYLACFDETSEILYVGGQTLTAKVRSQPRRPRREANLYLYNTRSILASIHFNQMNLERPQFTFRGMAATFFSSQFSS